jgi:GNAT superfamily N-acetyltransferase
VALTIGGKRRKPGGGPPAVPLTVTESRLVNRLVSTMNTLSSAFDVDQYAEAIRNLDPDLLEQLLTDVNIDNLNVLIDDTLRDAVMDQASNETRRVIRNAPRTGNSPFLELNYAGEVLPSGIIMPTPEMVTAPDVEFFINEPVERMFRFVSQRATDYASTRSATLVRQIDESNRLAIREVISRAFTEPRTVDETARTLRQIVGLHPRWARAVERFNEKNLVRLVREGMSSRQAQETANAMTERYRKKLIRRRAEMIARTEIQQAQNYARQTSWEATESLGLVDPRSEKELRTALATSRYGPPCDECAPLNGSRVPWNGVFENGKSMPPFHPNCRCTAVLIPPTRGLTGLPSQNMQPWIDRLDELETEAIESIEMVSDVVVKHQQGSHDQKTHGAWATGRAPRTLEGTESFGRAAQEYMENSLELEHVLIAGVPAGADQLKAAVARNIATRMSDVPATEMAEALEFTDEDTYLDVKYATGGFQNYSEYIGARWADLPTPAEIWVQDENKGWYRTRDHDEVVDRVFVAEGRLAFVSEQGIAGWRGGEAAPVGSELAEQYAREVVASEFVRDWAATSNGSNPVSLALQEAAAAEFDVKGAAPWKMTTSVRMDKDDILRTSQPVLQRFVREQYNETQEFLKGTDEVVLWRGSTRAKSDPLVEAGLAAREDGGSAEVTVQTRPMSSWSISSKTAGFFAHDRATGAESPAVMMKATIPTSNILSTPLTGFGSWSESEFVTIGSTFPAQVAASDRVNDMRPFDSLFKAADIVTNIDNDDDNADWIKSLNSVIKHQQGSHDQKTHGAWATGGAVRWIDSNQADIEDPEYAARIKDSFNKTWEESLGVPGATVETEVFLDDDMSIRVESVGSLPNGDTLFSAYRTLVLFDEGLARGSVQHKEFYINPEYQGKGIATRANQKFFDLYRENGMSRVTLQANADVGGYTWAKQGFDWRTDSDYLTNNSFESMKRMLRRAEQLVSIEAVGYDVGSSDFYNDLRRDRPNEWPTPLEIAMAGHTRGATTWPGKEAMLGDDWLGVLRL